MKQPERVVLKREVWVSNPEKGACHSAKQCRIAGSCKECRKGVPFHFFKMMLSLNPCIPFPQGAPEENCVMEAKVTVAF